MVNEEQDPEFNNPDSYDDINNESTIPASASKNDDSDDDEE